MKNILISEWILFPAVVLCICTGAYAEQSGGIRGTIYDKDFDAPLGAAQVMIAETGETATTSGEGNYSFTVEPGNYTLVFSKDGYTRQVVADVVVSPGQMTEVDASLAGEFVEMEEFIVQDVQIGTGTEAALLELRLESPALMDSISAELMSQAGASDAASALRLVAGATVQEGKYAIVRGLPDRYVNSQMNGVRLPTADADKRAVQLDQFPAAVIESIQVSKTFTPDQQGDASGGAVNVVLKGIPEESILKISSSMSWNKNVRGAGGNFISYKGGGLDYWGKDDGSRDPQEPTTDWGGAVGVMGGDPTEDYKWSVSVGGKKEFEDFKIGGFASIFYERDSSFYDNGIDDKYWVNKDQLAEDADDRFRMTPQYDSRDGGRPSLNPDAEFYTSLFDVTQSSRKVQWGGLGIIGIESENHSLTFLYMSTRDAEDKVTLAEDTRGRSNLHTYWPDFYGPEFDDYDIFDPFPGGYASSAPLRRNETLEYTERTTETLQLSGRHTLFDPGIELENLIMLLPPEFDWTVANSKATLYQPDKRLFSTTWVDLLPIDGWEFHGQYIPFDSAFLGNLQRIWKNIEEDSEQYFMNFKLPYEQWTGDRGYVKFGVFNDKVYREYDQETYSNFNDLNVNYRGAWEDYWSKHFPDEEHFILESDIDVDYTGEQNISAWYYMIDVPVNSYFSIIGGTRFETTDLSIDNDPEDDAGWYPTDITRQQLTEDEADVAFKQDDILSSWGFEFNPFEELKLRGTYSETVARQTFKELTPIQQLEYLGADLFYGNPDLGMSALKNYDLRLDWTPYEGGLVSFSYFFKDVTDPIEYIKGETAETSFTKPVNYPEGEIEGYELEVRQRLGHFWESLEGISIGANATLIDSVVTLPQDEADALEAIGAAEPTRDMTNAPEHLYNFYVTYDLPRTGTVLSLFYTVRGDTLISGASRTGSDAEGRYIPSVYETEYATLNMSVSQELWDNWKLKFAAKNLLDPAIETVYRSAYIGDDVTKSSYTRGIEFSLSLSCTF